MAKDPFLVAHEELCAERYKNIENALNTIQSVLGHANQDIIKINQYLSYGRGGMKVVALVGSAIVAIWGAVILTIKVLRGI